MYGRCFRANRRYCRSAECLLDDPHYVLTGNAGEDYGVHAGVGALEEDTHPVVHGLASVGVEERGRRAMGRLPLVLFVGKPFLGDSAQAPVDGGEDLLGWDAALAEAIEFGGIPCLLRVEVYLDAGL